MSRMWWYTLGTIVLWVVNPELRRLFDWRFGYLPVDVFPLFPFLAVIPHIWSLTYGGGWRRLSKPLSVVTWIWLGAFGYAFVVALINGNALPGTYDFMNFVLPASIGLWIAADKEPFVKTYDLVMRVLFGLTTIISVYGIVQYAVAPAWDTMWLQDVIATGSLSFGRPAPFLIRVFSMLSSPGPFGNYVGVMLLLALPQLSVRRPWMLAQIPFWLIAFGLSLDRSGWLLFASGLIVYLLLTPRRGTLLVSAAMSAALLSGLVVVLPAVVGNATVVTDLSDRLATFSDLGSDRSANDRQNLYDTGSQLIAEAPFGRGLGVVGTATKLSDAQTTTDFDSGVLARLVEMGVPGALLYVVALGILSWELFGIWRRAGGLKDARLQSIAAVALAVVLALGGAEISGDVNGLLLVPMWLIAGFALRNGAFGRASELFQSPRRAARRTPPHLIPAGIL